MQNSADGHLIQSLDKRTLFICFTIFCSVFEQITANSSFLDLQVECLHHSVGNSRNLENLLLF